VCCDGISGVDASEFDTLIIAGMGGDTIREILDSGRPKLTGKRLILSAHTKQAELLSWLLRNGVSVRKELLVRDRGKTYLLQLCAFD
jgi:tRNA (adenine22-N1)-methyltransferase